MLYLNSDKTLKKFEKQEKTLYKLILVDLQVSSRDKRRDIIMFLGPRGLLK